jgi:CRISPR-associated protein Cmr3
MADLRFLITPSEPVLFGPPKSFVAGEAHRITSQFPPSPLTFQGIIRTRLLLGADPAIDLHAPEAASEVAALVGKPSELPPGWQIRGPFPARRGKDGVEPWIPTPRFLLGQSSEPLHAQIIESDHPGRNDLAGGAQPVLLGRPDREGTEPRGGWIGPANLRFALGRGANSNWDETQWQPIKPPFVKDELQPGLAIDRTKGAARHGLLYFAEALRFDPDFEKHPSGLFGELRATLSPPLDAAALAAGSGQLGRKGRLGRFSVVEVLHPDWEHVMNGDHLPGEVADDMLFWLVAITPVRLSDPTAPSLDAAVPSGVSVRFVAALTGRPMPLGGYQLAKRGVRPTRLYVPAGSAWLFQVSGGLSAGRAAALRALHGRHPLGPRQEAAMGFGHTLVGIAAEGAS